MAAHFSTGSGTVCGDSAPGGAGHESLKASGMCVVRRSSRWENGIYAWTPNSPPDFSDRCREQMRRWRLRFRVSMRRLEWLKCSTHGVEGMKRWISPTLSHRGCRNGVWYRMQCRLLLPLLLYLACCATCFFQRSKADAGPSEEPTATATSACRPAFLIEGGGGSGDGGGGLGRQYSHADIWGEGVRANVALNESSCFLIAPKDTEGELIDKDCSPAATNWVVLVRSSDGRIRMRASMMHLAKDGFHMPCYRVVEPGTYVVSVMLMSVDAAASGKSRMVPPDRFPSRLVAEYNVTAQADDPAAYLQAVAEQSSRLPRCTWHTLSEWRGSEGRWIGNQWFPENCRLHRFTPIEARQCLAGKRILMVGDSQQLMQYATTVAMLASDDSCAFLNRFGDPPVSAPVIRCDKRKGHAQSLWMTGKDKGSSSGDRGTGGRGTRIAVHETRFGSNVSVLYYGTPHDGFAFTRIPQFGGMGGAPDPLSSSMTGPHKESNEGRANRMRDDGRQRRRRRRGRTLQSGDDLEVPEGYGEREGGEHEQPQPNGHLDIGPGSADERSVRAERLKTREAHEAATRNGDIILVFAAHTSAAEPVFRDWMVDRRRLGPLANQYAPFDYVLASSGVHDLMSVASAENYSSALDSEFIPSLRLVVRNSMAASVAWVGSWSIQQDMVAQDKRPTYNQARAEAFYQETAGAVRSWEIPFIETDHLTLPRPDLCTRGAHYSWPVARAVLELWLSSMCPARLDNHQGTSTPC